MTFTEWSRLNRRNQLAAQKRKREEKGLPEPTNYQIELRRLRNSRYRSKIRRQQMEKVA